MLKRGQPEDMMATVKVEAIRVEKGEGAIPVCGLCRQCFATVSGRNRHIRTLHEGERHACQVCDKLFNQKSYLNNHIRAVHQGEKPYPCTECGKDFADRCNLRRHTIRIHQTERINPDGELRKKTSHQSEKTQLVNKAGGYGGCSKGRGEPSGAGGG